MNKKGYCFDCNKNVEFTIREVKQKVNVKGIDITCKIKEAYCKECGGVVLDKNLEKENEIAVFDAYKRKIGLLTSKEIIEIRKKRGMTQAELSNFLSIGVKDITRYENGAIQTESIDKMIRMVNDDSGFAIMENIFDGKDNLVFVISEDFCKTILEKWDISSSVVYGDKKIIKEYSYGTTKQIAYA